MCSSPERLCPAMDAAVAVVMADAYARGWIIPRTEGPPPRLADMSTEGATAGGPEPSDE
jgi:hypothetical protein